VPLYESASTPRSPTGYVFLVEAHRQYALLFYNLACCESLTSRTIDALEHLRRALDMTEEFRGKAKLDSDLDPIRNQRAFRQLISD
jgi:hypothetical protein